MLSGQWVSQSLTETEKKRTANSHSIYRQIPPVNITGARRAALQEKSVEAILHINTQIQLAWLPVDRLSHHH